MDTTLPPIERAIAISGGASNLARALGLSWPSIVTNWVKRGVPADRCLSIERATSGAVTRYELRPDVFGDPPTHNSTSPSPFQEEGPACTQTQPTSVTT